MGKEFEQSVWGEALEADVRRIVAEGVAEDLGQWGDWTTRSLVDRDTPGSAAVVLRQGGVLAGLRSVPLAIAAVDGRLRWKPHARDGDRLTGGASAGLLCGPAAAILSAERLVLNLLGRLSGIATLTARYVEAIAGTAARIYDTRKTTPGWRRLEKYAVRCGGGQNHRAALFAAVLIKDNHLALGAESAMRQGRPYSPAEAVERARQYIAAHAPEHLRNMIIEVEVDTLEQFDAVLGVGPDIVLLDNMPPATLRTAVERRDAVAPAVELEASGGVQLETVRAIAASGVDRISVGALTHSPPILDIGLDWQTG